ncbi:acyl carrier protein [Streptomyces samsunensis]|uniref:Polyketide-8 synthase acyl carrier protein 2 n=3 Tax=Streptomyces TaxID=1883 RepID=A0A2J7YWF3_STRMQ|nr:MULTISPECIES: acyl carrier protein [Streptomyces]ALF39558.1 Has12 [Streptomyces sp. LZ35]AQA14511.1 polyketide-8 synthase acyl carrier protein [Streptomyces autolyticus]MCC4318434.1 acyl carrier protein [Streptomyces malaysiensis]MCM3810731.1 acyl carrier protein [Streptomyces sp. DR7-3]NUH40106.1 acyl carrier protein [Streptomyces samsunensis]
MSVTYSDAAGAAPLDMDELRGIVADILEVDATDVADDADFMADLEVDSLMALEVIVVLEKKYGVKFAEAELRQVVSLNQAHELLTQKLRAR